MINLNYTLILTIINFLILVYVLKKLFWGPLTKFLDDRARGIEDSIRAAEVNREEAQRLIEQQEEALRQARTEAKEIVDRGIAEAAREARRVRQEAAEQAARAPDVSRQWVWALRASWTRARASSSSRPTCPAGATCHCASA